MSSHQLWITPLSHLSNYSEQHQGYLASERLTGSTFHGLHVQIELKPKTTAEASQPWTTGLVARVTKSVYEDDEVEGLAKRSFCQRRDAAFKIAFTGYWMQREQSSEEGYSKRQLPEMRKTVV
ncbi:hypothetical protein CSKR_102262 [Clonorchis sinensis]|uniref:Uncharacterized protein n=1 Tax=Clonorchis sinensis TaxID=79923 RepID=A0A3R7D5A1_CLOSI|nr:hypothetical protein CSKR_102262 [Clonorchis sinensis]